jgi:hypothetical protein
MVASLDVQLPNERREYERVKLFLPGHLFDPQTDRSAECKVLNLSAGGAALQCAASFPPDTPLVLYVDGFGRFQGRAVVHANEQLALQFVIGEAKRGRLIEMLQSFGLKGLAGITQLRKHVRVPSLASGSIVRENGKQLKCDVLDVSLEGVSLRTRTRPPIGEIVMLGRAQGRIVRHHADGIAIQYVKETNRAA